jgi:hypothetical protein
MLLHRRLRAGWAEQPFKSALAARRYQNPHPASFGQYGRTCNARAFQHPSPHMRPSRNQELQHLVEVDVRQRHRPRVRRRQVNGSRMELQVAASAGSNRLAEMTDGNVHA